MFVHKEVIVNTRKAIDVCARAFELNARLFTSWLHAVCARVHNLKREFERVAQRQEQLFNDDNKSG